MTATVPGRAELIEALRAAVAERPEVIAMLLGGSDAFGRTDPLSDVDVTLVIAEGTEPAAVFERCEAALETLAPIEHRMVVPEPAWHGHSQRFYRLEGTHPCHLVDLFVQTEGRAPFFDEVELHGVPVTLFDRRGETPTSRIDPATLGEKVAARREQLRLRTELFACFVEKELERGHPLAALHFYQSIVLATLVELLRLRHGPSRHDWGVRYAHVDLPPEVNARLEGLSFLGDLEALRAASTEALAWVREELAR